MNEHLDRLLDTKERLNCKENEIALYANTHDIPQELRNILVEWANLKTQLSEVNNQLAEATEQRMKESELEKEAREKEYQEKIKAIESQAIEGFVRFPTTTIHLVKRHQVLIED